MSAVSVRAKLPLYEEALAFWDELTLQCGRHVKAINACIKERDFSESEAVKCQLASSSVCMIRSAYPSTEININLHFEHWGPKIAALVRGKQDDELRFYPEEFDFEIGCDEDGKPVAISAEGRSMTPHEVAKYLTQHFRRCFAGLTLPSLDCALE